MKTRELGKTSLRVSELCLGTMIFGEEGSRGCTKDDSIKMINKYVEEGGNFIDTADVYSHGISENIVGEAIEGRREEVVIATKCRFPMGKSPNMRGFSRKYIKYAVNQSLERLKTEYIDFFYLHGTSSPLNLETTLRTLDDLVSEGKIHHIGVSNFRAWEVMKALSLSTFHDWTKFEAAQYQHSLVERNIEHEFVGLFLSESLSGIPWGPLGGGFLTGKYKPGDRPDKGRIAVMPEHTEESWGNRAIEKNWRILDVIQEISTARDLTYSQIALNWLLNQPSVTAPIIGVRTIEQLEDNLGASGWDLSAAELQKLDEVSKPSLEYPYRFIQNYCLD